MLKPVNSSYQPLSAVVSDTATADASNALVPVDAVAVPGHDSTNATAAGVAAVPMDEDTVQQPVTAYFQVLNNRMRNTYSPET